MEEEEVPLESMTEPAEQVMVENGEAEAEAETAGEDEASADVTPPPPGDSNPEDRPQMEEGEAEPEPEPQSMNESGAFLDDLKQLTCEPEWVNACANGLSNQLYLKYNISNASGTRVMECQMESHSVRVVGGTCWSCPCDFRVAVRRLDEDDNLVEVCSIALRGNTSASPFDKAELLARDETVLAHYKWKMFRNQIAVASPSPDEPLYNVKIPFHFFPSKADEYMAYSCDDGKNLGKFETERCECPKPDAVEFIPTDKITTSFPEDFDWRQKAIWLCSILTYKLSLVGTDYSRIIHTHNNLQDT